MDVFEKYNFIEKSCFIISVFEFLLFFGFKVLCFEVWISSEEMICYFLYKVDIVLVWKDFLIDI